MRPTADANEQSIISRAKGGDLNAFELLVRKYQRLIYALCHHLTGAHQAADDLAQETFVKAYWALPELHRGPRILSLGAEDRAQQLLQFPKEAEQGSAAWPTKRP